MWLLYNVVKVRKTKVTAAPLSQVLVVKVLENLTFK